MKREMDGKRLDTLIARFFSEATIRSFLEKNNTPHSLLKEFFFLVHQMEIPFSAKTYGDLFEFAYDYLSKNYRNEYIYKNAIAKNILLGKHSLNTSSMLQEFRIGNCKADTVVLNGTSNVYEIKSELDSLDRLNKQIIAYRQVFDMVHVITYPGQSEKIKSAVPAEVGIMELTQKNSIGKLRDAISGKENISTSMLFDSLRQPEYTGVLLEYYGYVPEAPNTKIYSACKNLFTKIDPIVAHDLSISFLKKRADSLILKDFVNNAPNYFKAISLSAKFSENETSQITKLLTSELSFS